MVSSECPDEEFCIERVCNVPVTRPRPQSYGIQIAIADTVAVATLGMGSVFSGPIVHLAHGRYATAVASFFMRAGSIAIGAGSGVLLALALPPAAYNGLGCESCPPSPDYLPQMFVGLLIGAGVGWIVASVVDAVFLAHAR